MTAAPGPTRRLTALITGASGGIGADLAESFARHGHDLILVARTAEKLDEVGGRAAASHGIQFHAIVADLSEPAGARRVIEIVSERAMQVDVLVNNAGVGTVGPFATSDPDRQMRMIQLNVATPTFLTRQLLPGMIARRRGGVLNVASTAAFQPGPLMSVYYASKAYLLSFSEALANEVGGTGVTVTCLCPGPTHTGFVEAAEMQGSRLFNSFAVMRSRDVADAGYEGFATGKRLVVPGVMNKLVAQSARFSPRGLVLQITRRLNSVA
jgi:short-subunit dehydrogenase